MTKLIKIVLVAIVLGGLFVPLVISIVGQSSAASPTVYPSSPFRTDETWSGIVYFVSPGYRVFCEHGYRGGHDSMGLTNSCVQIK